MRQFLSHISPRMDVSNINSPDKTTRGWSQIMPIEYICDSRQYLIGSIETTAHGIRIAYNKDRERVGLFDVKANRTCDGRGRFVGTGDQLARLIGNSTRK